jgi:hypothetical protein
MSSGDNPLESPSHGIVNSPTTAPFSPGGGLAAATPTAATTVTVTAAAIGILSNSGHARNLSTQAMIDGLAPTPSAAAATGVESTRAISKISQVGKSSKSKDHNAETKEKKKKEKDPVREAEKAQEREGMLIDRS